MNVDLATIPGEPGVYLFKDAEDRVLYVGKAGNLRSRLGQYRPGEVEPRKEGLLERAVRVEVMLTGSEKEALLLESSLIKRHHPRYNVRLTDDKRYPYIRLTADEYPRVMITRDTKGRGQVFGPFPDAGAARRTVQVIREVFKIRDCKELIPGGCLNYQMDLCSAPCIHDAEERRRKAPVSALAEVDVDEAYARASRDAAQFLRGDASRLTRELQREMDEAAQRTDFERAATLRDRLTAITATLERQAVFSRGIEDRDAFALARDAGLAVGVVVLLRGGAVAGQEHYFFRRLADGLRDAELLTEFIQRYYENLPTVPRELVVPEAPANGAALAEHLSDLRGGSVKLIVPQRGELKQVLDLAVRNARFKIEQERLRRGEREGAPDLEALQRALGLDAPPRRIECFDVSHFAGTGVVASMSVLLDGRPVPGEYRRFKVRVDRNDDFAAMEEVVSRRYARVLKEEGALPDLVVVDGGRGQLAAARRALADLGLESLPLAALAKREEEIFLRHRLHPVKLEKNDAALHVLQRARDEAHRFALRYQRTKRAQALTRSALDDIPGVGAQKKRALLAHFGSVERVAKAHEEDLSRVPGVGPRLARVIRERLGGE